MRHEADPAQANPITRDDVINMLHSPTQLSVEFQPQVNLKTGHIESAEVLARWVHPTLGPISPARFVPVIAAMNLQGALFKRVVRLTLDAAGTLKAAGLAMPLSINACAATLTDPENLTVLHDEARRRGIKPSRLTIELTEEPAINPPALRAALDRLRHWGYKVSLDDFGAGHANMNRLIRLPLDELKLDRSIAENIEESHVARQCVKFALGLSRTMGWRLVTEGISTVAQLRALHQLGCRHGQGFLLGRPMSLAALMAKPLLSRQAPTPSAARDK